MLFYVVIFAWFVLFALPAIVVLFVLCVLRFLRVLFALLATFPSMMCISLVALCCSMLFYVVLWCYILYLLDMFYVINLLFVVQLLFLFWAFYVSFSFYLPSFRQWVDFLSCCSVCFISPKRSTCHICSKCYRSFDDMYFSLVVIFVLCFLRILCVRFVLLTLGVLWCSMLFSAVLWNYMLLFGLIVYICSACMFVAHFVYNCSRLHTCHVCSSCDLPSMMCISLLLFYVFCMSYVFHVFCLFYLLYVF